MSETVDIESWGPLFEEECEENSTNTDYRYYPKFQELAYCIWFESTFFGETPSNNEDRILADCLKAHNKSIFYNTSAPEHLRLRAAWQLSEDDSPYYQKSGESLSVREDIASSELVPVELLNYLSYDEDDSVRCVIAANVNCSEDSFDLFYKHFQDNLANDPNPYSYLNRKATSYIQAIAANVSTPSRIIGEIIKKIKNGEFSEYATVLASDPATHPRIIEEIAKTEMLGCELQAYMALHPSAPLKLKGNLLEKLQSSRDDDARRIFAESILTPSYLLQSLCEEVVSVLDQPDKSDPIRYTDTDRYRTAVLGELLVENCAVSALLKRELAKRLSAQNYQGHRGAAASCLDADAETLLRLAKEQDDPEKKYYHSDDIRRRVAKNTSITPEVAYLLSKDNVYVVRRDLATNTAVPTPILQALSADQNEFVRSQVAANPSTPLEIRLELIAAMSSSVESRFRGLAAMNPACPEKLLIEMARDKSVDMREKASANPSLPLASIEFLAGEPAIIDRDEKRRSKIEAQARGSSEEFKVELVKKICAGAEPSYPRALALTLSYCPPAILKKCSKSPSWLERCAVAQNTAAPSKVLEGLLDDDHPVVCAAARWALSQAKLKAKHNVSGASQTIEE